MNALSSRRLPARPLSLPNILTYARIAAVPVLVGLLFWQSIFNGPLWLRWVALVALLCVALLGASVVMMWTQDTNPFLYFRF